MTRRYNLIEDFLGPGDTEKTADELNRSPFALIAVWRYRYPATFSRTLGHSITLDEERKVGGPLLAVDLQDNVLLISDDIKTLNVGSNKDSHISKLSATLLPGSEYLSLIMPGDIVASWMVNSQEDFVDVLNSLKNGKPTNYWRSGLKFFGKVDSVRKALQQAPTGTRSVGYTLTANGFTELDASIYFEPYLQNNDAGIATEFLRTIGTSINNLMADSKRGITIDKLIPVFMKAFYGEGIPKNQGISNSQKTPTTNGLDNPNCFLIPGAVAKVFGLSNPSKSNGLYGYSDLIEIVHGIQQYQGKGDLETPSFVSQALTGKKTSNQLNLKAAGIFIPSSLPLTEGLRDRYTGIPMSGTYLPSPPQFNGQRTVWSIIQQFLNPTINEMYCTLRINPEAKIMPTMVVRQLPFSSGLANKEFEVKVPETKATTRIPFTKGKNGKKIYGKPITVNDPIHDKNGALVYGSKKETRKINLTKFLELPRWNVHPILVQSFDVGRSDAMRQNFLHVYGDDGDQQTNRTAQFVRNPPMQDELDILRHGLRPYMATVPAAPQDIVNSKASDWMYILSDIIFGQQLTLTGSISLHGIQSPICIGDNIEFEDAVFHIQSVQHVYNQTPAGVKTFMTGLQLTHGMRIEQLSGDDLAMYTGVQEGDLAQYDPSVTDESAIQEKDIKINGTEDRAEVDKFRQAAGGVNLKGFKS